MRAFLAPWLRLADLLRLNVRSSCLIPPINPLYLTRKAHDNSLVGLSYAPTFASGSRSSNEISSKAGWTLATKIVVGRPSRGKKTGKAASVVD